MLFSEYRFFKDQSKQLIELQEDYRNYITVLRKAFDSQKADNYEVESFIEEKKKPFITINREKKYLKKSFLDYLKKKKMQNLAKSLKHFYSEEDLTNPDTESASKKFRKKQPTKKPVNNIQFRKHPINKNQKNDGMFIWPINQKEFWISSFFGLRKLRRGYSFHYGIDMAALKGTTVNAAASGEVKEASYSAGYGNTIVISHDQKYKTRYAHLNTINVKIGQQIKKGEKIGTVGDSGSVRSSGKNKDASHLHFEVYVYGKQINPLYVLQ